MELNPKKLAEAALFMATEPLDLGQLAEIMSLGAVGQAKNMLNELMEDYRNGSSALDITLFDDRYRMRVKDKYLPKVAHLTISTDYSRAALKTLSVVAFKQPILQSEVVKIRGQGTYEHVKALVSGGLISKKPQGRSSLLAATRRFEDYFGTSVEKLKETYGDIEFFVPEGEGVPVEGTTMVQEERSEEKEEGPEKTTAEEPEDEMETGPEEESETTEEETEEVIEVEETGEGEAQEVPEEEGEEPEETQEEEVEESEEEEKEEERELIKEIVEEPVRKEEEEPEGDQAVTFEEEDALLPSERAELDAQKDIYSEQPQRDTNEQEG